MNRFHTAEIERIVAAAQGEKIPPELPGVIYSLGRDATGEEEYAYAFALLARLAGHPSAFVASMAVLSFSLLAVYHGHLAREVVEPLIQNVWERAEGPDQMRIQDAVEDINQALGWGLAMGAPSVGGGAEKT